MEVARLIMRSEIGKSLLGRIEFDLRAYLHSSPEGGGLARAPDEVQG
jgi:hypothetical protein